MQSQTVQLSLFQFHTELLFHLPTEAKEKREWIEKCSESLTSCFYLKGWVVTLHSFGRLPWTSAGISSVHLSEEIALGYTSAIENFLSVDANKAG